MNYYREAHSNTSVAYGEGEASAIVDTYKP